MTSHDDLIAADRTETPPPGVRRMAVVRWVLVLLMAAVAVGSVAHYLGLSPWHGHGAAAGEKVYYCPMHPQIVQDRPGDCPICGMTLVQRSPGAAPPAAGSTAAAPDQGAGGDGGVGAGKYYCPMHPHVTSDDPSATCPLCGGMKLVPRPPEAAAAPGASPSGTAAGAAAAAPIPGLVPVDIPIERVQKIGVRTATVRRQALSHDFVAVGAVEASERGLAQVTPRFSGWIEAVHVSETGQRVKRGQPLATIYSPDVLQAQEELLTALGWAGAGSGHGSQGAAHPENASAQALVDDARRRLELLGVSPQEVEALVRTRKAQRALPIRSPVDGHVIARNAVLGMTVSPGTPLFELADLSTVWVVADVYEADLRRVRVGQPARFEVSAYPGDRFTGKVQFVHPTVDPSSRTVRVRLEFRNRPGPGGLKLRPGMYGNVSLDLPQTTGLVIPAEAVADTGTLQYVFAVRQGGRFEPRRVKLGARGEDTVEVLEGLAEGEVVVTSANFLIDSESRLRAAIEGQTSGSQGGAAGAAPAAPSACDAQFDKSRFPDKHQACLACEVQHRGMGSMVDDCKKAIARPWR